MAKPFDPSQVKSTLGWSNSFQPNAAFPLDIRQYFGSYEAAPVSYTHLTLPTTPYV